MPNICETHVRVICPNEQECDTVERELFPERYDEFNPYVGLNLFPKEFNWFATYNPTNGLIITDDFEDSPIHWELQDLEPNKELMDCLLEEGYGLDNTAKEVICSLSNYKRKLPRKSDERFRLLNLIYRLLAVVNLVNQQTLTDKWGITDPVEFYTKQTGCKRIYNGELLNRIDGCNLRFMIRSAYLSPKQLIEKLSYKYPQTEFVVHWVEPMLERYGHYTIKNGGIEESDVTKEHIFDFFGITHR